MIPQTKSQNEMKMPALVSRANSCLDRMLPAGTAVPQRLHDAMRYAAMAPGKRVRPLLCYAAGQALGVELERLDAAATAVELIHAYSLIHDDLPAMDDDDLRRGRPTTHIAYDEATAILAGDALQAKAFELIASAKHNPCDADTRCDMTVLLADACGSVGMAGGQAIDLGAVGNILSLEELKHMHSLKTGALIKCSVELAWHASAKQPEHQQALTEFGTALGLAFQIQDDILDVTAATDQLGKPQNSDVDADKPTFVSLCGLEESERMASELMEHGLEQLNKLPGDTSLLATLADYIVKRSN